MMRGSAPRCRMRSTIHVLASRTRRSKRALPSGERRRCARRDRQRCDLAHPEQAANSRALARSGRARTPVAPSNPLLVRLLLQLRRKVCNYSDGLADLLRNPVEKDFLAVWRDIIEDLRSGPVADEILWGAELQGAAGVLYRDREKIVSRVHIVEIFAVVAPWRERSSFGRDLPLALPAAKGHHIHLKRTGLTRTVGQPMAVRGKLCLAATCYDQRGFALPFER